MSRTQTFVETRTIEVLDVAEATRADFDEFLADTVWAVIPPNNTGSVGILHEAGKSPASAGRHMFSEGSFLVKVNGKLRAPVSKASFSAVFPNLAPAGN